MLLAPKLLIGPCVFFGADIIPAVPGTVLRFSLDDVVSVVDEVIVAESLSSVADIFFFLPLDVFLLVSDILLGDGFCGIVSISSTLTESLSEIWSPSGC